MKRHISHTAGFTLLELLVAVAIFAVLAALTFSSLNAVVKQRDISRNQMQALQKLQQAIMVMEHDIDQAVPRAAQKPQSTVSRSAMQGGDNNLPPLSFTRGGWRNPLGEPRSSMQQVAYTLTDKKLIRLSWPVLDPVQGSTPVKQVLLTGVSRFSVRFMDDKHEWTTQWPPLNADPKNFLATLPLAVEITLDSKEFGRITRIMELVR